MAEKPREEEARQAPEELLYFKPTDPAAYPQAVLLPDPVLDLVGSSAAAPEEEVPPFLQAPAAPAAPVQQPENPDRVKQQYRQAVDALETAWGVIANVNVGDWSKQSPAWRQAANNFREDYYAVLDLRTQADVDAELAEKERRLRESQLLAGLQDCRDALLRAIVCNDAMAKFVDIRRQQREGELRAGLGSDSSSLRSYAAGSETLRRDSADFTAVVASVDRLLAQPAVIPLAPAEPADPPPPAETPEDWDWDADSIVTDALLIRRMHDPASGVSQCESCKRPMRDACTNPRCGKFGVHAADAIQLSKKDAVPAAEEPAKTGPVSPPPADWSQPDAPRCQSCGRPLTSSPGHPCQNPYCSFFGEKDGTEAKLPPDAAERSRLFNRVPMMCTDMSLARIFRETSVTALQPIIQLAEESIALRELEHGLAYAEGRVPDIEDLEAARRRRQLDPLYAIRTVRMLLGWKPEQRVKYLAKMELNEPLRFAIVSKALVDTRAAMAKNDEATIDSIIQELGEDPGAPMSPEGEALIDAMLEELDEKEEEPLPPSEDIGAKAFNAVVVVVGYMLLATMAVLLALAFILGAISPAAFFDSLPTR